MWTRRWKSYEKMARMKIELTESLSLDVTKKSLKMKIKSTNVKAC